MESASRAARVGDQEEEVEGEGEGGLTVNDVEHSGRETSLDDEFGEFERGQSGVFGGFEDDCAAYCL